MSDQPPGPGYWKASDGNWYPPQSAPQQQQPVQPIPPAPSPAQQAVPPPGQYVLPPGVAPSKSGMSGGVKALLVIGALVLLGALAAGAFLFLGRQQEAGKEADAAADVEIVTCEDGDDGQPDVEVEITNSTGVAADYVARVVLQDADGTEVGRGDGPAINMPAGEKVTVEVDIEADGEFTECVLDDVIRVER